MANKDKLLESAQKFLEKGQLAKAIGEYQKLIEAFPKDYRNRQKLAELLGREKRNDEAQPHYETVAKNFTETGFYLKAIAIYKQMQKIEPSRVDIYLRLAELNEKQGLIGNALNEYRSLVAFYDQNRMARETVGVLQKMIALEPENLGVRGKLIETLTAIGEEPDALEQFRTLVRLLASKGEQAKVVKLYEKFSDLAPEDVENRLPLGAALLASGQAEKALPLLKGLLKQAPDHPDLLLVLTDCHLALDSHADARLTCQHLLKEQPQNLELRERYIRICLAANENERALESLEEAKEQFSAANRVGVLKDLYESLQPVLPDNARLRATLAAIYEATGDAGSRPVFAAAERPALAEEETADAAILDAAISDVEQLDLVGEAVAPVVEVPPLGAPAVPVKPAKVKGGLELELDLDLDLEPPVATAAPVVQAPSPAVDVEMELELDLGELGRLEVEPPLAEPLLPPVAAEPEPAEEAVAEAAAEEVAEEVAEEIAEEIAEAAEEPVQPPGLPEEGASAEAFNLEDFGELEIEIEPPPADPSVFAEEPLAEAAAATPPDASPELEGVAPPLTEAFELPDKGEAAPEVFAATAGEADEPLVVVQEDGGAFAFEAAAEADFPPADAAIAGLELAEELEEVEELEEIESLDEVETLRADEPLEELEELEDLEDIVEEEEPGPVGIAAFSVHRLRDDLEEAEFFLRQGLFDDAERVVVSLQGRYAEHPELNDKLAEISAQRQAAAEIGEKSSFSELMSDLIDDELLGATDFLEATAGDGVDEFSLGNATEDDEDAQSHFDLGIAYKEMGLLDDAITEFGKAARDNSRRLDCLILKGQCQVEMGEIATAEATFKEALGLSSLTDEVRVALRYELGLLYENSGRLLEALECYQIVADHDLFFRDVTDKLKSLRQTLGLDDDLVEPDAPTGNRDRISFI